MIEKDIKNFGIISKLVEDHFNLDNESLEKFKRTLFNADNERVIDPKLKKLLGEDLRFNITLSEETYSGIDNGWLLFKDYFSGLLKAEKFEITYKNFKENKIVYNKNVLKLFKATKNFYKEEGNEKLLEEFIQRTSREFLTSAKHVKTFDDAFQVVTEKIGTQKIPDRELKLVVSLNFADWFLSATSEEWQSCLGLEAKWEGAFWSGLPGTITDPNRMLIYMTDGSTKEYLGIEAESMITRTWGILTKDEKIFPVRSYPSGLLLDDTLNNLLNKYDMLFMESQEDHNTVFSNSENWQSKYPIDLLYSMEEESVFIYQDHSTFYKDNDGYHIQRGSSGLYAVVDDDIIEDSSYDYSGGLKYLVENGISLGRYLKSRSVCNHCDEGINQDESYVGIEGEDLCADCFYDKYSPCQECGEVVYADEVHFLHDMYLCTDCYEEKVTRCEDCEEAIEDEDDICFGPDGETLCEKHWTEQYAQCDKCGDTKPHDELKDGMCKPCRSIV